MRDDEATLAAEYVRAARSHERVGVTARDAGSAARMQSGSRYWWAKALQSLLMAWRPE
jgi:hypothetical protein